MDCTDAEGGAYTEWFVGGAVVVATAVGLCFVGCDNTSGDTLDSDGACRAMCETFEAW